MTTTWMTRKEAAEYLRVSLPTIDRYAASGRLTKHTVPGGRAVRFKVTELDALLKPAEGGEPDAEE